MPHSLSYQEISFTKVLFSAMPALMSTIDENLQPGKSVLTTSSSVWDRMPFIGPAAASLMAATISSMDASFSSLQVRSTTDTSGVGTRKAMPVSLPFRDGMTLPTALAAPVAAGMMFSDARRPVHRELVRGHRVDRRHKALDDAELVVDRLSEGRKAVRRARRVARHRHVRGVRRVVHAHHEHRHIVLRRRRDDHLLAATADVEPSLGLLREDARRLADVVRTRRAPRDGSRVLLGEDLDDLAVHDERLRREVALDGARVLLVNAVVLQQVDHVLKVHERIVDRHHLDLRVAHRRAEHEAANAPEAVDPELGRHEWRSRTVGTRVRALEP